MFYPMLLVDNYNKPWRGSIYANNESDINNFLMERRVIINSFCIMQN